MGKKRSARKPKAPAKDTRDWNDPERVEKILALFKANDTDGDGLLQVI